MKGRKKGQKRNSPQQLRFCPCRAFIAMTSQPQGVALGYVLLGFQPELPTVQVEISGRFQTYRSKLFNSSTDKLINPFYGLYLTVLVIFQLTNLEAAEP